MKLVTSSLILNISLIVFTISISSFVVLQTFSQELEKTVTSDITIAAINAMDKIDREINTRITDIRFLTSPSNLNLHGDQYSTREKTDYLREYEALTQMYTSSSIYDLDGIKIGDTRNLKIGIDQSNELFFKEAIQGKIFHDSSPVESKSLGIPIIHFSGPVYDDNGNINGVILLNYSPSKISDIMVRDGVYSKPIHVTLISNEGSVIFTNYNTHILSVLFEFPSIQNFIQSTNNQITFTEFNKSDEREELFVIVKQQGFNQYAGDDWILVFDISTNVLFAESDNVRINIIYIAIIICLISIFISVIFTRKISKPLNNLVKLSTQVSKGELNVKIVPEGNDEIIFLGKSFNIMIDSIKNQKEILVQKDQLLESKNIELYAEREKLNKSLVEIKRTEKLKSEFSSMVSHELKTPLTPIRGYCEMLTEQKFGKLNDDQLNFIKTINSNAIRLERLIGDVLDVQKLDMNRMLFLPTNVNIDKFLEDIRNDYAPLMKEKQIQFDVDNCMDIFIQTDPFRLRQVFDNLIRNSLDFVHIQGKIKVGIIEKSDKIIFFVKDNGIGISKENQEDIFKKFYQVDTSQTRKHGGTGLGLIVCKGIVEGQHGEIWLESEPEKGATFYFSLTREEKSKNKF